MFIKSLKTALLISGITLLAACSSFTMNSEPGSKVKKEYESYVKDNKQQINRKASAIYVSSLPYKEYIVNSALSNNMPRETYVLAGLESSFNNNARGENNAYGMWQITKSFAHDLGLSSDDLNDWKKTTDALMAYMNKNGEKNFDGKVELSVLAHNIGTGGVKKLMKRNETDNIWVILGDSSVSKHTKIYMFDYMAYSSRFKNVK